MRMEVDERQCDSANEKMARAEALEKKYEDEVKALTDKICFEDTLGPTVAQTLFKKQITYAEGLQLNAMTTSLFLNDWVKNFKENLKLIPDKPEFFADHIKIKDSCIIVGAGPSLSNDQIDALKDYKGTILCVNKSLKRLLERGIVPDIVSVIHSTDEVLGHFDNDIVKEYLPQINLVLCSTLCPKVTNLITQYSDPKKTYWFHSDVPDNIIQNLNMMFYTMVPLEILDTGGNIGLMCVQIAQWCGAKTLGIVGMEHCVELDKTWTNEESMNYNIIYAPQDDELFALTPVMRAYLQVLHNWYMNNRKSFSIYNLTPHGLFYVRRRDWMPFMPIREYVRRFD